MPRVTVLGKKSPKQFREPVGVDEEPAHSAVYQMIERESDQRFLKNRYERFREVICQRTQTGAASGGQNECLGDFLHQQKNERFLDFARNDKKSGRKRMPRPAARTKT